MKLSQWLKALPGVSSLNALRRSYQVESRYRGLVSSYEAASEPPSFRQLVEGGALPSKPRSNGTWRVIFCGTDELQDYGGFIQSLSHFCELRVFRGQGGRYGQSSSAMSWDENRTDLTSMLQDLCHEGWVPDILMMQSMGTRFRAEDLQVLKHQYEFAIVNIGMDERLAYRLGVAHGQELGISGINPVVDLALVTVPEAVKWYAVDGVPAKYFPLACDERSYFPRSDIERSHDVGFVGRAYGRRNLLARKLYAAGIEFEGRGPGWERGELSPHDSNSFYNSCRIVLGMAQIGYSKTLMNPKLRDFEVPFSGSLYITNYTNELAKLFIEDYEMVFYRSDSELIAKLKYYLVNESAREAIADRGHRKALAAHRYDFRFERLFNGLLSGLLDTEFVS